MRAALLLLLGITSPVPALQQDSTRVYKAARSAEARYEYAARQNATIRGSSGRRGQCDEVVGRFCLYYDTGHDTLPREPETVTKRRIETIEQLRAAFALNPVREATVFPLMRLLLEARDTAGLNRVARTYRESGGDVVTGYMHDVVTGYMLEALAAHAAAGIPAAERAIERWLESVDSAARRKMEDLSWLLESKERDRYRKLTPAERADYEARFWRYADALYLTPGNETRTEHFARHAESRLLQTAPVVRGGTSWGDDVYQLTIRYGTPRARTRDWPNPFIGSEVSITEHWDPNQMMYAPPRLDTALATRARPRGGWPLDTVRSRSGHAPPTFRRMVPLEHQAAVFRREGAHMLAVFAQLPRDSAQSAPLVRALVVLDADLIEVARAQDTLHTAADTVRFDLEVAVPPSAAFYSAEMLDLGSRKAARARYRLELPEPADLFLSDILLARPFETGLPEARDDSFLVPLPAAILAQEERFGIFAEVDAGRPGADSIQVQLELVGLDGSPAIVRAARWLGRVLGVAEEAAPTRISWGVQLDSDGTGVVAVTVDPQIVKPGRYFVTLTAVDRAGRRGAARREILIE